MTVSFEWEYWKVVSLSSLSLLACILFIHKTSYFTCALINAQHSKNFTGNLDSDPSLTVFITAAHTLDEVCAGGRAAEDKLLLRLTEHFQKCDRVAYDHSVLLLIQSAL